MDIDATDVSQSVRIEVINKLNRKKSRPEIDAGGFCNGDSLMWSLYMYDGKSKEYNEMRDMIVDPNLDLEKIEEHHEKYMKDYYKKNMDAVPGEIKQDHEKYLKVIKYYNNIMFGQSIARLIEGVNQVDYGKIINLAENINENAPDAFIEEFYMPFIVPKNEVVNILNTLIPPNKIISLGRDKHAVSIFYDGNTYHFFNPNAKKGSVATQSLKDLEPKILKGLKADDEELNVQFEISVADVRNNKNLFNYPDTEKLIEFSLEENKFRTVEGSSILLQAVKNGRADLVQKLIEKGANVNEHDTKGMTMLMKAALFNHSNVGITLVKEGADIRLQDEDGFTAVTLAAALGYVDMALKLVEEYTKITNNKNNDVKTPLMIAAELGNMNLCLKLIEKNNHVNAQDNEGNTALLYAIQNNHLDVMDELIEQGADVNTQDKKGYSVLLHAVQNYNLDKEVSYKLIEKGANLNEKNDCGFTAIGYLSALGDFETAQTLIEKYIEIMNAKNNENKTALMYTVENNYHNIAFMMANKLNDAKLCLDLIEKGVDVNAKDKNGDTFLLHVIQNDNLDKEVALKLVEKGADIKTKNDSGFTVIGYLIALGDFDRAINLMEKYTEVMNAQNNEGKTALIHTVELSNDDLCVKLIEGGADVNAKDNENKTALMYAIEKGDMEIALLLIKNGAEIDTNLSEYRGLLLRYAADTKDADFVVFLINKIAPSENMSALMYAVQNYYIFKKDVILQLIDEEVNINAKDNTGMSVLMHAIGYAELDKEIIFRLIEKGSDVTVKNDEGNTVLIFAIRCETFDKDVALKLIDKGADLNIQDNAGKTVLMHACERELFDEALILIELGANLYAKNPEGVQALDFIGDPSKREMLENKFKEVQESRVLKDTPEPILLSKSKSLHSKIKNIIGVEAEEISHTTKKLN